MHLFRNRLLSRQKSFRLGIRVLRRSTKFWSKFWLGRRFENYQTQVRVSPSVRGSMFKVGPIPDGYLANVEARQRRNQLQNEQAAQGAMTSHGVMTSQQTALQIQPTQTHTQPTITPVITPHVYVSQFFIHQSDFRKNQSNYRIYLVWGKLSIPIGRSSYDRSRTPSNGRTIWDITISPTTNSSSISNSSTWDWPTRYFFIRDIFESQNRKSSILQRNATHKRPQ